MFLPLRDENPTRRFPLITIVIIGLNTALFLYQAFSPQGLAYFVQKMGVIPYEITHLKSLAHVPRLSPLLTLFTSMFLHGSLFHLFGNMLFLWIFGNNVEDDLGSLRFILFYLLCGLGAGFTQIVVSPNSRLPMIGASGAVAGVLGAYFLLYPGARVLTFVFLFVIIRVVPIPAAYVLGLWFIAQVLNIGMGGGVAWFAHIGGFLLGAALIKVRERGRRRRVWLN
jgi:membrane associated rhomboid family serine protease